MWVSSSKLEKERRDTMKKRTFIIKVLHLIAINLLLLTILVIAIKIWHSFISDWVSTVFFRDDIPYRIECYSFYVSFPYIFIHCSIIIFIFQFSFSELTNTKPYHTKKALKQELNINIWCLRRDSNARPYA